MNTNPGPDDARRPGRSFSDAAALFQPIIPAAGAPVVVQAPVAPPPDDELPPATGPQPIPDAPHVPPAVTQAGPTAFRPLSATQERPAERAADVRIKPVAEAPRPAPEPVHQAVAPSPPPQVRRRWPMLAIPVLVAAIAGLAWLQLVPGQMQPGTAIQGTAGDPPATAPERPASPPAPVPSSPVAPAIDAVAPPGPALAPVSPPPPSATATVTPAIAPAQPDPAPPGPEPAKAVPTPPPPPMAEAAPQPAPAPPNATAASQPPMFPLVVVRMRAGSAAAQAEATRIAALLTTSAARLEVQGAPTSLRTPSIRYFRAEDASGARALASALPRSGTPWRVQRMRTPRNAVPGRFEVWLTEP